MELKSLTFSNSKSYFIYFNTSLYNTPNIKGSIFLPLYLNIISLFIFYYSSTRLSLSLSHTSEDFEVRTTQQTQTLATLKP